MENKDKMQRKMSKYKRNGWKNHQKSEILQVIKSQKLDAKIF